MALNATTKNIASNATSNARYLAQLLELLLLMASALCFSRLNLDALYLDSQKELQDEAHL